jgi:hypothetical protein
MKEYTASSPEFSKSIIIPETTDTNHADNINSAPKQLLQNTLANKTNIENLENDSTGMKESLYLAKSLAKYNGKDLGALYTPAEFKTKVSSGDFSGLELGDYFDITLTTNEKMRYVISGFNTYLNYGDSNVLTANHVIMTPLDCMKATAKMNDTADNTGGYAGSLMPAYLETILETFPTEWKNVMRAIRRLENNKGAWAWATRTLFLLSETEVHGSTVWSDSYDGGTRPLPLYQFSARYRIKGLGFGTSASGNRSNWWLASPSAANTAPFAVVNDGGGADGYFAYNSYGVAPGFCI